MGSPLRFLSLCTRYLPLRAGADNYNHQAHLQLVGMGHEVTVVAINDGEQWQGYPWRDEEVIDGVQVLRPQPGLGYEVVAEAVERCKPDVLFGQFGLLPYTIERAYEVDLPVVIFCHTAHGYADPLASGLVELVDLFVFNSTHLYDTAKQNVRHVIVTPPLELDRVVSVAKKDPKYITLINLCQYKGTDVFYKLAKRFPEQLFMGVEGGYDDQVKEDHKNVVFHEHTSEIHEVYAETRVLLMPSEYESFGMAALEAQANGIPVIASDLPSLHDSLGDGAVFVKRNDLAAWEAALHKLLVSRQVYSSVVDRARHNIERFDFARDMRQFEVVLQDVVRKKRARPCVHGLMREYEALREYVVQEFRKQVGREPKKKEVDKILEGPYKPDELVKVLGNIEEIVACIA